MKYIVTHKNFDNKGRRVSIFGWEEEEGILSMIVITCSKKDVFCKKTSHELFIALGFAKEVVSIPILSGDSASYTLNRWAKHNYYRKVVSDHIKPGDIFLSHKPYKNISKLGQFRVFSNFIKLTKNR